MIILNNNLPDAAYRTLGVVKGQQTGTAKQAHDGAQQQMKRQARHLRADAVLGLRYHQTAAARQVRGTMSGIAIRITNRRYAQELFQGAC